VRGALTVLSLALGLAAGCASGGGGSALLLVSDAYELHLRDGRLYVVEGGAVRPVRDPDELRSLYRRDGEAVLPESESGATASVLGWRDLACVRSGQACGREPDRPARDMVRLRLRF
jgi:hypothetical protein